MTSLGARFLLIHGLFLLYPLEGPVGCWATGKSAVYLGKNRTENELKQKRETRSCSPNYRHELHVVVDEIYMLSVFDESARFHSVLSLER